MGNFANSQTLFDIIDVKMQEARPLGKILPVVGKSLIVIVVGLLLVGWLLNTPGGLLGKADAIGYAVCHRIDARSFHMGDRQLPLCARCSGMYLGAMLGMIFQVVVSGRRAGMPHWSLWIVLGLFVAAFGIDGINSYLHLFPGAPSLYEPSNLGRLLTGTGMGLVIAFAIYPAFNQTVWRAPDMRPALGSVKPLAIVIGMGLILDWLVWIDNPFLLFIFALVSALGVLVLLTMVYGVFWTMLLKSDNRLQRLSQLAFPLLMGFGTALMQIALFDLVRYMLTGTWDGFHLG
jgi:uncharacterized membrane protein